MTPEQAQEIMSKVDNKLSDVDAKFEEFSKNNSLSKDAILELIKPELEEVKSAYKELETANEQLKQSIESKKQSSDDIIRPDVDGVFGTMSPLELVMAVNSVPASDVAFRNRIHEAAQKASVTKDNIEAHFAALEAADPTQLLPVGDQRRRNNSIYRNQALEQVLASLSENYNVLATGSGGAPAIAAAEMIPQLSVGGQLFPRIPVDPRLVTSGNLMTAGPVAKITFVSAESDADPLPGTEEISVGGNVQLLAKPVTARAIMGIDYQEDFAFGDAVREIVDAVVLQAGPVVDSMVAFGDTDATASEVAAGNINLQGGAGGVSNPGRRFDGYLKLAFASLVDGEGSINMAKVGTLIGSLDSFYGGSRMDRILILSSRNLGTLEGEGKLQPFAVAGPDGGFRGGFFRAIGGVEIAVVDELNTDRNAAGRRQANQTLSVAGVANTRAAKGGFARNFRVSNVEEPANNRTILKVSFRWAQVIGEGANCSRWLRNV